VERDVLLARTPASRGCSPASTRGLSLAAALCRNGKNDSMTTGAHILVVDDDPRQLSALRRILHRSGHEVTLASSGRLGLRLALRSPPDLVLLDVAMPTMSGHEFLRRLRRLEARGRIRPKGWPAGLPYDTPVVFLTAMAAPHQRVSGLDAGAVDYVIKPFDADELRARIRRQLREARRTQQALAAQGGKTE
jgi:DNA-binding response OmpR family regulator